MFLKNAKTSYNLKKDNKFDVVDIDMFSSQPKEV
jgi:hypothetical protein